MIEETLREIGLSKNEVKIYLALLELGPSRIGDVCGKTKIHRRNVYDSIEMLKDKGFVSSTLINNRNVFEAANPEHILDILEEKKTNIQTILPQLIGRAERKQPTVRVYTGVGGRKRIFEDKLRYIEEQQVLGGHMPPDNFQAFLENYHKRRIKKKIPLKMLFASNELEAAKRFGNYRYTSVRILPDRFNSPIAINIYGEKVAMLLTTKAIEPLSILIEDVELANDFRTYFKLLWAMSKRYEAQKP